MPSFPGDFHARKDSAVHPVHLDDDAASPRIEMPNSPEALPYSELSSPAHRQLSAIMAGELAGSSCDLSARGPMRSLGGSKWDRLLHSNMLFDGGPSSPRPASPGAVKRNNFFDEGEDSDRTCSTRRRGSCSYVSEGGLARILSVTSSTPRHAAHMTDEDTASPHGSAQNSGPVRRVPQDWDSDTMASRMGTATPLDEGSEADSHAHSSDMDGSARPLAQRLGTLSVVREWVHQVNDRLVNGNVSPEVFLRAGPKGGLVRCYVLRKKPLTLGGSSAYHLYLADTDAFVLAARKRKKTKNSVYLISQSVDDLANDSDNCLAKLKANFVGTHYELWGKWEDKSVKKGYGQEIMALSYDQTLLNVKDGPRIMHVGIPTKSTWRSEKGDGPASLLECLHLAGKRELPPATEKVLSFMATKQAKFDEARKVYSLDFGGRVKEASVKNFQLTSWDHNCNTRGDSVLLQFGKVTADSFILDFAQPFSLHSAFAIALASIDSKLCYSF